jgi:hypothetical protein
VATSAFTTWPNGQPPESSQLEVSYQLIRRASSAFTAALTNFSPTLWVEVHEIARGGLLEDITPEDRVSVVAFVDVQFLLRPVESRACPAWIACVVVVNRRSTRGATWAAVGSLRNGPNEIPGLPPGGSNRPAKVRPPTSAEGAVLEFQLLCATADFARPARKGARLVRPCVFLGRRG